MMSSLVSGGLSAAERSKRSILVGNIPGGTTEDQLKTLLSEFGIIINFRFFNDNDDSQIKYAFCEYENQEVAIRAIHRLNNLLFRGQLLKADTAASDKSQEELEGFLRNKGASNTTVDRYPESETTTEKAPEEISKAVASLPAEQMFELMKQMKMCIENNPHEARNLLLQNPQLAYALLQAQILMRIVDPEVALKILDRPISLPTNAVTETNITPGPISNVPVGTNNVPTFPTGFPVSNDQDMRQPFRESNMSHLNLPETNKPMIDPRFHGNIDPRIVQGARVQDPRRRVDSDLRNLQTPDPRAMPSHDPRVMRGPDPRVLQGPDPRVLQGPDPRVLQGPDPRVLQGLDPRMGQDPRSVFTSDPRALHGQDSKTTPLQDPRMSLDTRLMPGVDPRIASGMNSKIESTESKVAPELDPRIPPTGDPRLMPGADFRMMASTDPRNMPGDPRLVSVADPRMGPNSDPRSRQGSDPRLRSGQDPRIARQAHDPRKSAVSDGVLAPATNFTAGARIPTMAPSGNISQTHTSDALPNMPAMMPQEQEKTALIMQVLQLSDEQIAMLPPEQRQSILILKEQIARSQSA